MKNILFYAPATHKGGGASVILIDLVKECGKRKDQHFIFIIPSKMVKELPAFDNITLLPILMDSYLKRLYYDFFGVSNIIRKIKIKNTNVVCLSNSGVLTSRKNKQWILVHNLFIISKSIPGNIKKNKRLFLYSVIFPWFLSLTYRKRHTFILQRESLKKTFRNSYKRSSKNILIIDPSVSEIFIELSKLPLKRPLKSPNEYYFCPLSENPHKNINLIHQMALLNQNYSHIFVITISREYYINNINNIIPNNIHLTGKVEITDMPAWYFHCSAVLFPSLVETVGLPLLEGAYFCKKIFSPNLSYSREILKDYKNAFFLDPNNAKEWTTSLEKDEFQASSKKITNLSRSFSGELIDQINGNNE